MQDIMLFMFNGFNYLKKIMSFENLFRADSGLFAYYFIKKK